MPPMLRCIACTLAAALALTALVPGAGLGYSSQPGQCNVASALPSHGSAQVGNGGFTIVPSSTTYMPGQPMTISVSHPTGKEFRGLLLYAFDPAVGPFRVGSFAFPAGFQAVSLGCPGDPNGTLGHSSPALKATPVDFTWTAPANGGSLTFVALVVVQFTEYYVLDPILLEQSTIGVPVPDSRPTPTLILLGNAPNPFRDGTRINYSLGQAATTSVRIYDLMGHILRDLPAIQEGAGSRSRFWDGRDAEGEALPSGVYFYRVEADGKAAMGKVVIRRD